MSSAQKSRSSSCSRMSRIPTSNSLQKPRGTHLGRPEEKKSLNKNFSRSSSNLIELPRFNRQSSGSLTRQMYCTPLKQCGLAPKSPGSCSSRKDNRPIFDKNWQYNQTVKVRTFICQTFTDLDYNLIKSGIPLDVFIKLMNHYAQLIDKRIVIKSENYVDEVPSFLKRYHYPVSVKPSLMKTVNAPHSWPHVLAILCWLTDTVGKLQVDVNNSLFNGMPKLVDEYMLKSYVAFNKPESPGEIEVVLKEFAVELDKFSNINEANTEKLNNEVESLKENESQLKMKRESLEKRKNELTEEIKNIKQSCNEYLTSSNSAKQMVLTEIASYDQQIQKLDQEIPELLNQQNNLKHIVDTQKCTSAEKAQLEREAQELRNTIELTSQRYEEQHKLLTSYDFQLSDLKQELERRIYKYNNMISELKLINPKFHQLLIRESGFAQTDMEEEIQQSEKLLKAIVFKLEQNKSDLDTKIEESVKKNQELDEKLTSSRKEMEDLMKTDSKLKSASVNAKNKYESERTKFQTTLDESRKQLEQLKANRTNLQPFADEIKILTEKTTKLKAFKTELKQRASDFFPKLTKQILNNYRNYMAITENISKEFEKAQTVTNEDSKQRTNIHKQVSEELKKTNEDTQINEDDCGQVIK